MKIVLFKKINTKEQQNRYILNQNKFFYNQIIDIKNIHFMRGLDEKEI